MKEFLFLSSIKCEKLVGSFCDVLVHVLHPVLIMLKEVELFYGPMFKLRNYLQLIVVNSTFCTVGCFVVHWF